MYKIIIIHQQSNYLRVWNLVYDMGRKSSSSSVISSRRDESAETAYSLWIQRYTFVGQRQKHKAKPLYLPLGHGLYAFFRLIRMHIGSRIGGRRCFERSCRILAWIDIPAR